MAKRRGKTSSRRGQSRGKKASRIVPSRQPVMLRSTAEKISVVIKNFITFLVLTVIAFVLYKVVESPFWNELFFLLLLIFGFVALAFVIVWLVLLWMKALRK